MKTLNILLAFFLIGFSANAETSGFSNEIRYNYGESIIFVEGDVEFSIYPNGEFDFYYNPQFARTSIYNMPAPSRNISYNSGFNYDPYLQYDDYGAVVQIENVPVFYDYYGRIIRAGNVAMNYDLNGRLASVGGLDIYYNRFDRPVRYVGYINSYNTKYVYRPWHNYYVKPYDTRRVVYYQPYRTYYEPVRMSYGQYANYYENNYYYNSQNYYRPGQQVTAYNNGRRTENERAIASATPQVRSNQNSVRQNASDYNDRENYTDRNSTSDRGTTSRSSANMERHMEAVRAQRGASATTNNVIRSTENNTSAVRTSANTSNTRTSDISTNRVERAPARSSNTTATESRNTTSRSSVPATRPAATTRNDSSSRSATLPSAQAKAQVERPTRGRSSGGI